MDSEGRVYYSDIPVVLACLELENECWKKECQKALTGLLKLCFYAPFMKDM
jgi:hypothetical protein